MNSLSTPSYPVWLNALREQATQLFSEKGFPTQREEDWRYTNLSALTKKTFAPIVSAADNSIVADLINQYRLSDCDSIVFVDGYFKPELSQLTGLPETVCINSIHQAQPAILENYFGQAINSSHGFIACNTAQFTDGVLIHLPEHTALDKPLQILHIVTQADSLAATRNIIVLDHAAQAEIIETFIGGEESYLTAAVNEVFLAEQADLTLNKVQLESAKAYHFGGNYIKQAQSSQFKHHNFALGGLIARSDIHSDLDTAAECHLNGLYLGVNRQHLDNHTRIIHNKPQAVSREYYKGILNHRARGVFQGRVIVAENAQQTDSEMNNRNLLLSADAEIDTKPQLEIYADDVKCSHGVTIGQLDEKSVFYLQSRGIDAETAKHLLTFAFANEMVDKVEFEPLKKLLTERLSVILPID